MTGGDVAHVCKGMTLQKLREASGAGTADPVLGDVASHFLSRHCQPPPLPLRRPTSPGPQTWPTTATPCTRAPPPSTP